MADTKGDNRPLSPHLTIYRPQITSMSSILTRISGTGLLVGAVGLVLWLFSAALGAGIFGVVDWLVTSYVGDLVMLGSVWALWYHLLAGARHLYWDQGNGLDLETAEKLGWAVIGGSIVLTLLTIIIL
ncbi:succinate dehydrogenase, cytochrome b556 subunit [Alphaproteobacteria bacterium KMM 3653]|uniref:Succinate dehydrogenase cytochrome b556 subunit n=1 Tax=Harenicola maris TaxID=2841044 RepID=A0AAP2CPA8_9RHOB|nr:succinate dehydrogenase, cytochrome b556 subunit [Harenicola maris]